MSGASMYGQPSALKSQRRNERLSGGELVDMGRRVCRIATTGV
jgi:hypothetical protein